MVVDAFQPLVSVIIPFYNCPYVDQAIESVLKQTYPNIEIIVVNDGSTRNTNLLTQYLSKMIYLEQKNKGVAAALNQGIKKAKGEYIVWLSSDDLFHRNKIKLQVKYMKRKNSLISFTDFNLIDEHSNLIKKNVSKNYLNDSEVLRTFLVSCPINGCTVMMSKEIISSVGYFNEKLKYAQDYEYWIRVALLYPIHYFPVSLTNYRTHHLMGSVIHRKEQMEEFNIVKDKYSQAIRSLLSNKD